MATKHVQINRKIGINTAPAPRPIYRAVCLNSRSASWAGFSSIGLTCGLIGSVGCSNPGPVGCPKSVLTPGCSVKPNSPVKSSSGWTVLGCGPVGPGCGPGYGWGWAGCGGCTSGLSPAGLPEASVYRLSTDGLTGPPGLSNIAPAYKFHLLSTLPHNCVKI